MENIKNQPIAGEGRIMAELQGNNIAETKATGLDKQREDSPGGTGEEAKEAELGEPLPKLKKPSNKDAVFEDFRKILQELQHLLVKEWDALRIASATIPARVIPEFFETGHGGIRLTRGKAFTALLTNGKTISAD